MDNYFKGQAVVGEMIGTMIMVFGIMLAILLTKKKSFGIDTTFKKRMFMGTMAAFSVLLAAITAIGFGGHGQINPAVTLMVAAIEGEYKAVPSIIAFQALGAILGAILLIVFAKMFAKDVKLTEAFNYIDQTPQKTAAMELIGNIFGLLPIGALLIVMFRNGAASATPINGINVTTLKFDGAFGHFELLMVAIAGKFMLVGAFDEFGAAAFNGNSGIGRMVITVYAHKKLPFKASIAELTGVGTSLAIGVGVGYFSKLFLDA